MLCRRPHLHKEQPTFAELKTHVWLQMTWRRRRAQCAIHARRQHALPQPLYHLNRSNRPPQGHRIENLHGTTFKLPYQLDLAKLGRTTGTTLCCVGSYARRHMLKLHLRCRCGDDGTHAAYLRPRTSQAVYATNCSAAKPTARAQSPRNGHCSDFTHTCLRHTLVGPGAQPRNVVGLASATERLIHTSNTAPLH